MSDAARMKRGLTANVVAIGTRIAIQFASLPILFAFWDVEAVGAWLLLFAVPSYVALIGNGFAGAGGTAALASVQSGDMDRARADFRAAWVISAGSTGLLALVFAAGALMLAPLLLESASELDVKDVALAAAWLGLYVFATSQMGIFDIAYRAVGRYPDHLFLYSAASLLEIVVLAAAVASSDSFATLAAALAVYRCLAAGFIWLRARRAAPAMFHDGGQRIAGSLPRLWAPSLAFMMMPLVFGLNLQGYLILVGASFGAVALAGFAATRTLTRLLDLANNLVYSMQFYESGYLGADRTATQRRLLATMTCVSLFLIVTFAAVLLTLGPWIQSIYTLGETRFDHGVAAVLVAAVAIRALAATPAAFVAAENAHARFVSIYLVGSAAALGFAVVLASLGMSLPIVLMPLLLAELSQLVPVFRQALSALDLSIGDFARSLISIERWADLQAIWRKVTRT